MSILQTGVSLLLRACYTFINRLYQAELDWRKLTENYDSIYVVVEEEIELGPRDHKVTNHPILFALCMHAATFLGRVWIMMSSSMTSICMYD